MKILAIESSCDETAAAVVAGGRTVLSSVIASQVEEHRIYGGVVPEIASRRHAEAISAVTSKALNDAAITLSDIDGVAVTYGPGLIGCLLVGVNFAKGLSMSAGIPIIPVHHLRSHVAANYLEFQDLKPPFISLIVSGGHSHIVLVSDYTSFEVIGRTRDDAVGECYDKVARSIGLPYPGGVEIDKLSIHGDSSAFKLPYPRVDSPFDFSFSGLKTAVVNLVHNAAQKEEALNHADLAASFQKKAVEILTTTASRAIEHIETERKFDQPLPLVLAGGVAANSGLRASLQELCDGKRKLYLPPLSLCGDNAAMVGAQGFYEFQSGHVGDLNLNAFASLNIETLNKKAEAF